MVAVAEGQAHKTSFDAGIAAELPAGQRLEITFQNDAGGQERIWLTRTVGSFEQNGRLYGVMVTSTAAIPQLTDPALNWVEPVITLGSSVFLGGVNGTFVTGAVTEVIRGRRRVLGGDAS